ncbi:MAG: Crp/Fnr family transcriptional regulator [Deltaproteobacteria bacterium]|nr:Crp/Fnr family transcriptional regulator [Deltaproteobacteria bacterium]MBW2419883.1 Crp/Fnr family transcriptional regulator [Deltaproteobacteria bacterium]
MLLAGQDNTTVQVRRTYERSFEAGQQIFAEGEPGSVLYIIQAGEVELIRGGIGRRHCVARLGAGEFFGEMSVVLGEPRTAQAVAACDIRLLELDGETLEAMCVERPEIAIRLMSRLAARLIESERRLTALGVDDLLRPLVRVLIRNATRGGPDEGIRVPGTLQSLSAEAGLSMLEGHRAVHQLLDQKLVRLVEDELVAKDVDALSSSLDLPA